MSGRNLTVTAYIFTPNDYSQQLGFMSHPVGKQIQPHIHKRVKRQVNYTQETLFIRKGRLQIDFYSENQEFLESRVLEAGDAYPIDQRWAWVQSLGGPGNVRGKTRSLCRR